MEFNSNENLFTIGDKPMSIALLFDQVEIAKEWTQLFRQLDILPYFYSTLDEFWYGVLEHLPTLAMVDVRLMNQGGKSLKKHPLLETSQRMRKLPLAIYYDNSTSDMISECFDIFHLGHVNAACDLGSQLKSLLVRTKIWHENEQRNRSLEIKERKLQHKIDKLIATHEEVREIGFYQRRFKKLIGQLQSKHGQFKNDIVALCADIFSDQDWIESFSILEQDANGQKLFSPILGKIPKFQSIPSIWLSERSQNGIDILAQNMVNQVVMESLGAGIMTVGFYAEGEHPEKLLILKVEDKQDLRFFDWKALERYLSGLYAQEKLLSWDGLRLNHGRFLSTWHFLQLVDSQYFEQTLGTGGDEQIIMAVTFDKIFESIAKSGKERFQWEKCLSDFLGQLTKISKSAFEMSFLNEKTLCFLIAKSAAEEFHKQLKLHIQHFSFWRYFDNFELVIKDQLIPSLRMIPCSRMALFQLAQSPVQKIEQLEQSGDKEKIVDSGLRRKLPPQLSH